MCSQLKKCQVRSLNFAVYTCKVLTASFQPIGILISKLLNSFFKQFVEFDYNNILNQVVYEISQNVLVVVSMCIQTHSTLNIMTQKQNTLQLHCSKKEFQHLPSHYMLIYYCALKKKEIVILNGCSVFTAKHFVLNYIHIICFYASFLLYISLIINKHTLLFFFLQHSDVFRLIHRRQYL